MDLDSDREASQQKGAIEDGAEPGAMDGDEGFANNRVVVSEFERSIEKFFEVSDSISSLSGLGDEEDRAAADTDQLRRFSSMITFLKEWKYINYEPKTVKFVYGDGISGVKKDAMRGVTLPQFSSASVPKREGLSDKKESFNCKDSVLHAGGLVWALDWCPRVHERTDSLIKCEYLAITAHPPGSLYHQLGIPLTGRGIVQIWCIPNANEGGNFSQLPPEAKGEKLQQDSSFDYGNRIGLSGTKPRDRTRKNPVDMDSIAKTEFSEIKEKKDRGRPRKKPLDIYSVDKTDVSEMKEKTVKGRPKKKSPVVDSSDICKEKRGRGRPRKTAITNLPKRPRGRPKKNLKLTESFTVVTQDEILLPANHVSALDGNTVKGSLMIMPTEQIFCDLNVEDHQSATGSLGESLKVTVVGTKSMEISTDKILSDPNIERNPSQARQGKERLQDSAKGTETAGIGEALRTSYVALDSNCDEEAPSYQSTCSKATEFCTEEFLINTDSDVKFLAPLRRSGRQRKRRLVEAEIVDNDRREALIQIGPVTTFNLEPSASEEVGTSHGNFGLKKCKITKNIPDRLNTIAEEKPMRDDIMIASSSTISRGRMINKNVSSERQDTTEDLPMHEIVNLVCENYAAKSASSEESRIGRSGNNAKKVSANNSIFSVLSNIDEDKGAFSQSSSRTDNLRDESTASGYEIGHGIRVDTNKNVSQLTKDIVLPRLILCLAHMGRVAWDVKWRPLSANDINCKHHMGYLAVLLGDGSLEVWEIPLLKTVKILFSSCDKDGADPRFLKLKPVFRCSKLESGGKQCIPLTVEWSPLSPSDLLLAGCHDGTVALWKFSEQESSPDTKPLICFTADNVPIRSIAWAPDVSDAESANLFATAGHEGIRFWDARDPYHPLWDFNPVQRHLMSVGWFKNPRCILLAYDDGELRSLNLTNMVSDALLTGKTFAEAKPSCHGFGRLPFAIWSVQASHITGLVAYCGADGSASYFQLTVKSVERDAARHRQPHFLCCSLEEKGQNLIMNIPLPNSTIGFIPRLLHGLHSGGKQKRAKHQFSGDEHPVTVVPEDSLMPTRITSSSKSKLKEKQSGRAQNNPNFLGQEERDDVSGGIKIVESVKPREVFPSKQVAMHKVRWNMNYGSERWLCYGGAAGLVRCQEIELPY